ncbi:MFS general substrate transporter [Hortaea werneckii]|nr:MFS general substrate transporter [Hortaea werneckii]KAI7320004.1 MFS general substrate transporter [Hortaea werneckii]
MPQRNQNGHDQERVRNEASETTPLIPPPPTTVDASPEARLDEATTNPSSSSSTAGGSGVNNAKPNGKPANVDDDGHTLANQTISVARGILCTLALGFLIFLQATNISLITTTQSRIAADLDAFDKTSWFTSAYLIAMSALGPLNGKLSSVFSPRICIFASTIVLAIGSVLSSLAGSFETFVFGRAITGMGASGVFTISIIIVLELTGSKRRGIAIGLLNTGYTIGVAVGATAAGALLPVVGWRALFWIQAPVALAGGLVLLFAIPHDFTAGAKDESGLSTGERLARLDYFGALTLTAAIVLMLYSLSSPREIPIMPIVLSMVVLLTFVMNEIYLAKDPIIPISLMKSRGLLLTCLSTVGYMMARWCVLFYTPTYAIAVRQWSPATAGSILIPTNAGFAAGGLLVGWFHIRRQGSFYVPCLVVYSLFPITMILLAFLSTQYSNPVLYVLIVLAGGAVTGGALNYTLAHLLHLTPKSTHYIATSLVATFRGFAGSFGSAIGGGMFTRTLYTSLHTHFEAEGLHHKERLIRRLLGSPALVGQLTGIDKQVAINGYEDALRMLFLAGAGLAVLMVFVQAGTGWKGPKEESVLEEEREALVQNSSRNTRSARED